MSDLPRVTLQWNSAAGVSDSELLCLPACRGGPEFWESEWLTPVYIASKNWRLGINASLFYFFNWRIIALQSCVSFFCTTNWISCMCTYISSLLDLLPIPALSVILEHWAGLPVLYSSFPLAVCFTRCMYICQCYSLSSSHPLLPPLHPHVSTSVSLSLPCI